MTTTDTSSATESREDPNKPGRMAARFRFPGYPIQVGPTTHLAAERDRLDGLTWEHFDVTRLGATIGAILHGPDLTDRPARRGDRRDRRRARRVQGGLLPRPAAHRGPARRLRPPVRRPRGPPVPRRPTPSRPELVRFEKSADVAGYENAWHHDVTWREIPSMGAILHGIEVPEVGGDTLFADMYAAYEGLPPTLQGPDRRTSTSSTRLHAHVRGLPDRRADGRACSRSTRRRPTRWCAPTPSPAAATCTSTATSRRTWWAWTATRAATLIDLLCRQADYPEYQCRFHWEPHSVAFWDNRAVQHYASSDYWPQVRIMERASIIGHPPAPLATASVIGASRTGVLSKR